MACGNLQTHLKEAARQLREVIEHLDLAASLLESSTTAVPSDAELEFTGATAQGSSLSAPDVSPAARTLSFRRKCPHCTEWSSMDVQVVVE